jgi:hypothetical protein
VQDGSSLCRELLLKLAVSCAPAFGWKNPLAGIAATGRRSVSVEAEKWVLVLIGLLLA